MRKITLRKLLFPAVLMLLLTVVLLMAAAGQRIKLQNAAIGLLPVQAVKRGADTDADTLLVYDERGLEGTLAGNMARVLEDMRISYAQLPISELSAQRIHGCKRLLMCTGDLSPAESVLGDLITWLEGGGRYAQLVLPEYNGAFTRLYRKLGVTELTGEYADFTSITFSPEAGPLLGGQTYDDIGLNDSMLLMHLEQRCTVYLRASGDANVPLLWTCDAGAGRAAVLNCSFPSEKSTRYLLCLATSLLDDVCVYPVINALAVFVDDFPAPQPEGFDERLRAAYGYNVQGFFTNHWWPDMKRLCDTYGLKYSGVLVETYNDVQHAPYPEGTAKTLLRHYGAQLLNTGGEIGLHGYNHQPLCLAGYNYGGDDYTPWTSENDMQSATRELLRYGRKVFPEAEYKLYVPPSNYLDDAGRAAVIASVPGLRAISGVYLPSVDSDNCVQEFATQPDGVIDFPRITAGYAPDQYERLIMAGELIFHGVVSHFIHPDDVLDDDRGAQLGWAAMYESFTQTLAQLTAAYPELRPLTASSASAALQRWELVEVSAQDTDDCLTLSLTGRKDVAWLALRTQKTPGSVTGGTLHKLSEGFYWLRATANEVRVQWEAEP